MEKPDPPKSTMRIRLIPLWPQGEGMSASQLNSNCQAMTRSGTNIYVRGSQLATKSRKGQEIASAERGTKNPSTDQTYTRLDNSRGISE